MIDTFVVDLDGTLLQRDGKLNSVVCDYMIGLQKRGYTLVIATGRKYSEVMPIINQLKIKEYKNAVIFSDGQYLIDYSDNTKTSEDFLAFPDDYEKIQAGFEGKVNKSYLITAKRDYVVYPTFLCVSFWKSFIKCLIKLENPFGIMFSCSKSRVSNVEKIVVYTRMSSDIPNNSIKSSYQMVFVNDKKRFEFKLNSVNKCKMLKRFLNKKNVVPDRVAVFGNDENDMCMFEFFRNSFVIDTAQQNVKDSARNVIPYEDGIGVIKSIDEIIESGVN